MKPSYRCVLLLVLFVGSCIAADTARDSKKKTGSSEENKKMQVVDWVRSGALVVGFLATMFAGRQTWILADLVGMAAIGAAAFFFPASILGYQTTGELDHVHMYYAQVIGALMLALAAVWYYSRNTRDNAVLVSLLSSRVFGGAVLLMAQVFDHLKAGADKNHWSEQHLYFGILGSSLLVLGNLIQLVRSGLYGMGTVNLSDRLSRHLIFDLMIMISYGVFIFANPQFELDLIASKDFKPDGIHGHLVRLTGGLMFMGGLHGLNAFAFPSVQDKRAYFLFALVVNVLMFPTFVLYQWKYQFLSQRTAVTGLLIALIPAGNAAAAFFYRGKQKSY